MSNVIHQKLNATDIKTAIEFWLRSKAEYANVKHDGITIDFLVSTAIISNRPYLREANITISKVTTNDPIHIDSMDSGCHNDCHYEEWY